MSSAEPHARIAPPGFLTLAAPAAVLAALPGSRAVGGCVRDALAGVPVHDVDIAAPMPPDTIAERLRAAGLRVFETGLAHGTVTAVLDGVPVEVTALRRDVVTDGRRAEVAWTTDWREDAARRDFRINAMSLTAESELFDYFDGRGDLAAGLVRFVGEPAIRLAEDYLRALRFFRFWARFGRGEPDASALAAIRDAVPGLLRRVATERVWMELRRLLAAPDPTGALALMADVGLLAAVLPEAVHLDQLRRLVALGGPADPVLRLAALMQDEAEQTEQESDCRQVAERLRLSGREAADLAWLLRLANLPLDADMSDRVLRLWLASRPTDYAVREAWLAEARDGIDRSVLRERIANTPKPVFPLLGRDVLELGVPAGPRTGALLASVKDWWIRQGLTADKAACLAELRRQIAAGA